MNRPIIGISGSIIIDSSGAFPGYRRSYVNEDYVVSVIKNGGVPFIIPVTDDLKVIETQIDQIDGLILSGGHDVTPQNYHEEPEQKIGGCWPERDIFDCALIKAAVDKKIPILGICRGAQIINVLYGGNLYQDLSYRKESTLRHDQASSPTQTTHYVTINPETHLAKILDQSELMVNSFHHQIIKNIASNFTVAAKAKDGVVEAIEANDYPYLIGVQWHPEMLHSSNPEMNHKIFGSLIDEANSRKQR